MKVISQQGYQNHLVNVDSGSLKSRPNEKGCPFPSLLSEQAAVIPSVHKGVEEITMNTRVFDNPFYSPETPTEITVCQDQEMNVRT